MNIELMTKLTQWEFRPCGANCLLAIAPVTLGEDGQHASFYVTEPADGQFALTDLGETAMHASSFGVELSAARLSALNATCGVRHASIRKDGAIYAEGNSNGLQAALWDALKLAMSLIFNLPKWSPKLDQMRFRALVEQVLLQTFGDDRLVRGIKATGISGHTVEFPFGFKVDDATLCYVEPIALIDGKIDWGHVYQAHGKFSDVKLADDGSARLAIFEDGAAGIEFGRAATLLSQTTSIQTLTQFRDNSSIVLAPALDEARPSWSLVENENAPPAQSSLAK